jgi:large exoprotein involved in heme utilization and adhesion
MGTNTFGLGDAGNVLVMAGRVVLRDGAVISSTTGDFGSPGLPAGLGGSLTINADVVDVQGISPNGRSPSRIATSTFSPSDAGTLTVNARQVLLQEGGILATSSFSSGRAGDLIVNAGESVTLRGVATIPTGEVPSALSSDTFSENGRAGNLTVNTQRLTVADGAAVSVSTFGSNPGGTLTVNASRDISLSGTSADGFASGLYAQTFNRGNAGNLVVATDALQVSDRATLTVASGSIAGARLQRAVLGSILPTFPLPADPAPQDRGAAGNLLATIRSLSLDRGGQVLASTDSGQGGNLSLTVQDGILMRRGSLISATAGTEAAGGDGGNITINTPFLVTIPQENNDIIANAFSGQGGRVDITAQSIFFFTLRSRDDLVRLLGTTNPSELTPRRLPTNDISAISQQNPTLNGVVSLNTLGVDPSQGLVALPTNLVDPSQLVSQACKPQGNRASSLVSTGRGGLPENPTEALMDDSAIAPWVTPSAPRPTGEAPQAPVPQSRIVEISYWTHHPDGAIELVAISSQQPTRQSFTGCPQGN